MLFVALSSVPKVAAGDENAAIQYYLAIFSNGLTVPAFVDSATTDSPEYGFSVPLKKNQTDFLNLDSTLAALARFDRASECQVCDWGRFSTTFSELHSQNPIVGLQQLTRTVMLRARQRYQDGEWKLANRDVENALKLARRMVSLCRPYEHQPYMIENIANGTAAAYLLRLPPEGIDDLSIRLKEVGVFSPMELLLQKESTRLKTALEMNPDSKNRSAKIESLLAPYFTGQDGAIAFRSLKPDQQNALLVELSNLLKMASKSMNHDIRQAETGFDALGKHVDSVSFYFAIDVTYLQGELRENAQGICRGTLLRSVVEKLSSKQKNFSEIDDPFGNGNIKLSAHGTRHVLVSELIHHGRIDFSFGDAGNN